MIVIGVIFGTEKLTSLNSYDTVSTTSTRVGGNEELSATQNYDFIPVTHFRNHENTDSSNSKTQDALRRIIRKRVMITHMREKRRKDRKTHQANHDAISSHTENHYLFNMSYTGKADPFDATPFKLEAYMYDLLKYCTSTEPSKIFLAQLADFVVCYFIISLYDCL